MRHHVADNAGFQEVAAQLVQALLADGDVQPLHLAQTEAAAVLQFLVEAGEIELEQVVVDGADDQVGIDAGKAHDVGQAAFVLGQRLVDGGAAGEIGVALQIPQVVFRPGGQVEQHLGAVVLDEFADQQLVVAAQFPGQRIVADATALAGVVNVVVEQLAERQASVLSRGLLGEAGRLGQDFAESDDVGVPFGQPGFVLGEKTAEGAGLVESLAHVEEAGPELLDKLEAQRRKGPRSGSSLTPRLPKPAMRTILGWSMTAASCGRTLPGSVAAARGRGQVRMTERMGHAMCMRKGRSARQGADTPYTGEQSWRIHMPTM